MCMCIYIYKSYREIRMCICHIGKKGAAEKQNFTLGAKILAFTKEMQCN